MVVAETRCELLHVKYNLRNTQYMKKITAKTFFSLLKKFYYLCE